MSVKRVNWRARALAAERDLAAAVRAAHAVSGGPWPPTPPTQAEWDAMCAAEKLVRDAVGGWRRLAEDRGAALAASEARHAAEMEALVAAALAGRGAPRCASVAAPTRWGVCAEQRDRMSPLRCECECAPPPCRCGRG